MASVLLIEDDSDIRTAYNYALTKAGFDVTEASDGVQAAEYIEQLRPSVILLDMLMPGMSGLDFLRHTRVATRFPETRIVAVSNIDSPRVAKEAKELGVIQYIIKVETTPREIVKLVEALVKEVDDNQQNIHQSQAG